MHIWSSLFLFIAKVARGQDVVLAHAAHQSQPGTAAEPDAATAEDFAATAEAPWEDSLPADVRQQMEAAFSEAMAEGRAADFAEQAEYDAALRAQASTRDASQNSCSPLHDLFRRPFRGPLGTATKPAHPTTPQAPRT
jgi:hypothetical protein